VRSGLQPGERVIVNGLQRVRPNDQVAPVLVGAEPQPPREAVKTVRRDDKLRKTQI
jgi:multidrug efflux system membrane fusion protein